MQQATQLSHERSENAKPTSTPSHVLRTISSVHQEEDAQILPSLGKPRQKHLLDKFDLLAVLGSSLCLVAAIVTVSPLSSVPWRLGVTRQFQVLGVLMSLMNQCLLRITPQFLVLIEACFGPSYLQNFDAILRKSVTRSGTSIFWRVVLLALIVLPIGLSVAYKEFDHGSSRFPSVNATGSFYGMTGPLGLQKSEGNGLGLSFMANATIEYYNTALNANSTPPTFPQAYGFNTLVQSNTSSAKLDGPFPDYVKAIQAKLTTADSFWLDADVNGTVITYNKSIESHRNDTEFWDFYLSMLPQDPGNIKTTFNDSDIVQKLESMNLFNNHTLQLLMNGLHIRNTSWAFVAFTPNPPHSMSDSDQMKKLIHDFRHSAMLFHTRRERCHGTWRITYNSIQLMNGTCQEHSLPDDVQTCFVNATQAIPQFYMPSLLEYLGPFSKERRESPWLLPTFVTVLAGAFWSRAVVLNGYFGWADDNPAANDPVFRESVYYLVQDSAISIRPTMNASLALYGTLMVQPALAIVFLLGSVCMYGVPIDKGFGMIAFLAGVRVETLKLLKGASISGEVIRPLRVKILSWKNQNDNDKGSTQNEYILEDDSGNFTFSSTRHLLPSSNRVWDTLRTGLGIGKKSDIRYDKVIS